MGQRALVCYQDETGRWSAHYSHWGGLRLELARHLEGGLEAGGTVEQELPTVPVAGARLEVRADPDVEGVDRETIVEEILSWGSHDALYFVPAVGEVEAYLVLSVGRLHSEHEAAQTGALVTPGGWATATSRRTSAPAGAAGATSSGASTAAASSTRPTSSTSSTRWRSPAGARRRSWRPCPSSSRSAAGRRRTR